MNRICHQIWIQGDPPPHLVPDLFNLRTLNPDWRFYFWTNDTILPLLSIFPDLLALYNSNVRGRGSEFTCKSDIARYLIVYLFGGLYLDCDFRCSAPFSEVLSDSDVMVVADNSLAAFNWFPFLHKSKYGAYYFYSCHPKSQVLLSVLWFCQENPEKTKIGQALDRVIQREGVIPRVAGSMSGQTTVPSRGVYLL